MQQLVECVPNFSEGRDEPTIRALVEAIRRVPGTVVLDEEMDHDHHRSVLTFAGEPDAVAEAAFQVTRVALSRIDLRSHAGGHPRVGATDVVPFVPVRGVTMEDCVALAKQVGERIGRLGIPVFLYERAASHPERSNLEVIRRGGLEGLAARMKSDPAWRPDFGPGALHPTAGATVVGARPALIAFNVNLQSADVSVAKAIAKKVRFSGGGLPYVKAIGVELSSRRLVQVSMNLTNFEETPLHTAYEAVRREAAQQGVHVPSSEVVGLVPQRALLMSSEWYLKLTGFDPTQVLETRLELALAKAQLQPAPRDEQAGVGGSVSGFLNTVAAGTPTPGGGSVAALAGASAAALGVMACRISAGEPGRKADLEPLETRLVGLGERLRGLIQADAEAYAAVIAAYRRPKTDAARPQAIASSLRRATEAPLATASATQDVLAVLRQLLPLAKPAVTTDLRVGLLMGLAALEAACENVRVNLETLKDKEYLEEVTRRLNSIKQSVVELKTLW